MGDRRITREFRGKQESWFNRWIISLFLILVFLLNLFFATEFLLLSNTKNDITL